MIIVKNLKTIFNIILPIVLLMSIFVDPPIEIVKQDDESHDDSNNSIDKSKAIINAILIIFMIILLIAGSGLIIIKFSFLKWVITLLAISGYVQNFIDAYVSVGIIGRIVNSDDKNKMSKRERSAINSSAYIVWFFGFLKLYDFVMDKLVSINSYVVSDITVGIFCVVMTFIYIFHICALLPVFLNAIFKLFKLFYKIVPGKKIIRSVFSALADKKLTRVNYSLIVYRIISLIKQQKISYKILGIILFPVCFAIDTLIMFFKTCSAVFISGVGDICILVRLILKTILHLHAKINNITDKHMVAMSFRLATVISLVAIQIENRYYPFFKNADASTAVFEFVASAIIIPLIFEWIYSYRKRTINP